MKKLVALFALAFSASLAVANPYDWKVTRVLDGDTVEFEAKFLPKELGDKLRIRVLGVDTPEKAPRAQCEREAAAGQAATDFTKKAIANAKTTQILIKDGGPIPWDKFGGRVLGDVIIDGQKLSELLIKNGHARPYFGEKKASWCD
jgi:endonuclease YncB( thermonuclease family)